ncbi:MAG: ABC transporter permease [Opitutaceae bacterium]
MLSDLRFACRQLRQAPGFALVATLTLALGIGATSIMFSLAKALVLDPFPYPQPEQVVFMWSNPGQPLSSSDFIDLREQATCFSDFGVYRQDRLNLGGEHPAPVYAAPSTAGVLRALGIAPALGRLFNDEEVQADAPVAVISDALWHRVFGGDAAALGRSLRLDGREFTVVGILPSHFEFISPWHDGHDRELWIPLTFSKPSRQNHSLLGLGRLKPGISREAAEGEIKAIGRDLAAKYPDSNSRKPFLLRSLSSQMTERTGAPTLVLFGAVTLLLLVACANVAGLLLARATRRQGEFGVRLALGGSRRHILRLVFAEGLLLAAGSAAIGLLAAVWGLDLLRHALPAMLTTEARRAALGVDAWVLVFAVALAVLTTLLFTILPALLAARTPVAATLHPGGRGVAGNRAQRRFLCYVVVTQITLALVLANGAALLSTSYLNVLAANAALDDETVLTANLVLRGARYGNKEARQAFWTELLPRLQALPGVEHVAITSKLPLCGVNNFGYLVDDQTYERNAPRPWAENSHISPEYFAAMGLPLLRGRAPESSDALGTAIGVAVNRTLAEKEWPGQDPLGHRIRNNGTSQWFEGVVIGVVGDVRQQDLEEESTPEVYFPQARQDSTSMNLVVRAGGDARRLASRLRQEIAALDPELPVSDIKTLHEIVGRRAETRQLITVLGTAFTAAAVFLAMVGIYGTLAYVLTQRRREIGIRIALGARRDHILRLALGQSSVWVFYGLGIGVAVALAAAASLRSVVYGVSPFSPWSLLGAGAGIALTLLAAATGPALRATRVDPAEAIRSE